MAHVNAHTVLPSGTWQPRDACDTIALTFDERHRRRFAFTARGGTHFLLDLPRAAVLQQGDGLYLSDERIIAVEAAPERLTKVEAASPDALVRLAWHIGNRHLPAQLAADCILIREDHVITHMLEGLGARVTPINAPFCPESGAYSGGHGHSHDHSDGHEPGRSHAPGGRDSHDHGHSHDG